MAFLATFVLTFLLVFGALLFFMRRGTPIYRVERHNVVRLLELVLSGEARDADWQVFLAYPIRHDEELAELQRRCLELTETEYRGRPPYLFSAEGLEVLQGMLDQLRTPRQQDERTF